MSVYQIGIATCGGVVLCWMIYGLVALSDLPLAVSVPVAGLFTLPIIAATWLAIRLTERGK